MSEPFVFTAENLEKAKALIARYPEGRQASAVMGLLDLAQRQKGGWISPEIEAYVADFLGMPAIRVREVSSFYTMYEHAPIGRHVIQVCTTTPCWLRGSDMIVDTCRDVLGIGLGETTADGLFTLQEVECLGACVNAPVAAIGDDLYEDLTRESMTAIIETLKRGETPPPGSQIGRRGSCPACGATTLKERAVAAGAPVAADE
jgi:NADH dehydrogenase (ubiquinone) flavoprotein 2